MTAPTEVTFAALLDRATGLGLDRGRAAGSWVVDGNTPEATVRAILQGLADGDPQTMDMQPSPLSGEWADEPTMADVVGEITGDDVCRNCGEAVMFHDYDLSCPDDYLSPELLDAFELGFGDGFWEEVERSCRAMLGEDGDDA